MPYAKRYREERGRLHAQMQYYIDSTARDPRKFDQGVWDKMTTADDLLEEKINTVEGTSGGHNSRSGPAIDEFPITGVAGLGTSAEQVRQNLLGSIFNSASAADLRKVRNVQDMYRRRGDEDDSEHAKAFSAYLRGGMERLDDSQRQVMARKFVAGDGIRNAQSTTSGTQGGYIVPTGFSGLLEIAKRWFGGIANNYIHRFKTDTGNPWPWPTVNDTMNMGRIVGQNVQVAETDLVFGQVTFNSYIFSSDLVLVPLALIEDSYFNLDALVANLLGTRLGRLYNHYMTIGTGVSQPTGIVTAVVASGNVMVLPNGEPSSLAYIDLVNMEHSVDPAYRYEPSSCWMFNDQVLKLLKKLVDGNNRPLWQPGLTASFREGAVVDISQDAPTILGHPFLVNQDMSPPQASAVSVLFGDMSKFAVREVGEGPSLMRLVERYADYLQIGYISWERTDSQLLNAGTGPIWALQQSAS